MFQQQFYWKLNTKPQLYLLLMKIHLFLPWNEFGFKWPKKIYFIICDQHEWECLQDEDAYFTGINDLSLVRHLVHNPELYDILWGGFQWFPGGLHLELGKFFLTKRTTLDCHWFRGKTALTLIWLNYLFNNERLKILVRKLWDCHIKDV